MSDSLTQSGDYSVDLRELLEAGCHFGHQSRRWNPKMADYIYTTRDGVHIFDLAITAAKLIEAMKAVEQWGREGKEMVMVGTKRQAEAIVREEAQRVGAAYITTRWLGGTLSNWEEMQQRTGRLNELKQRKEAGELKKYTKKEQVLFDREIARLERFFGGIAHLKRRPEALFIVDTHREDSAVAEAVLLDVPIVGLVDSNADPDLVTHIIPVNDDAVRSIKLMVTKIADAYAAGKAMNKNKLSAQVSDTPSGQVGGTIRKNMANVNLAARPTTPLPSRQGIVIQPLMANELVPATKPPLKSEQPTPKAASQSEKESGKKVTKAKPAVKKTSEKKVKNKAVKKETVIKGEKKEASKKNV